MSQHFFVKLIPPRPTFSEDMSAGERQFMQQHALYWTDLMNKRIVVVFGPVLDPAGTYGIGIVEAEDEKHLRSLLAGDPANNAQISYRHWPMRAVHAGPKAEQA